MWLIYSFTITLVLYNLSVLRAIDIYTYLSILIECEKDHKVLISKD